MSKAVEMAEVRNEFAAVRLAVRAYGRGTRLELVCPYLGTSALLDATVLEALTRLSAESLAGVVGVAMQVSDETAEVSDATASGSAALPT